MSYKGFTTKELSANRTFTVWTSESKPRQSGLKFEHHGMTVFIPLRTYELTEIRDIIALHINSK